MHHHYYILKGKVAIPTNGLLDWARHFNNCDKTVNRTQLPDCEITTVFTGINLNQGEGEPILFETMISGGDHDGYSDKYSTWEEAEQGHQRAIEMCLS